MNDGPGPHRRPSSIETKQSIHGDEWGVDTNNNKNNNNKGGPYCYFSFIHMYAVTQTHTYGTDTMENTAKTPLGTPREGPWEQGWLTKHGGKGAWTGQARKKSWHHVNATATMIRDERPSPPLHNQHIIRKPISAWTQKQGLETSCSTTLRLSSCTPFFSVVLPGWDQFRGFSSTQGWSHTEVWPSNSGATCPKPRQLMEHGEYKSDWSEINLTRKAVLFTEHFHPKTLKTGLVMKLASDWGSVFTDYTSCRGDVCRACEKVGEEWS